MSDEPIHDEVSIEFAREPGFERQVVEGGRVNPRDSLAIMVDESSIAGGTETLPVSGYLYDMIAHLCTATDSLAQGEDYVFTASDGPTYVALRPHSENVVRVGHYTRRTAIDDAELIGGEGEALVDRRALVEAIIACTSTFRDELVSLDSELESDERIDRLERLIETARQTIE